MPGRARSCWSGEIPTSTEERSASLWRRACVSLQTADIMAADPYITSYKKTYSDFGLAQSKLWMPDTLCITIAGANTAKTAILKIPACFPDSVVGLFQIARKPICIS